MVNVLVPKRPRITGLAGLKGKTLLEFFIIKRLKMVVVGSEEYPA
jgi:hypothetical protein